MRRSSRLSRRHRRLASNSKTKTKVYVQTSKLHSKKARENETCMLRASMGKKRRQTDTPGLHTHVPQLVLLGEDPFGDQPYIPKSLPSLVPILQSKTIIGRDPSQCDLVIDSEKYAGTLSRTHCSIYQKICGSQQRKLLSEEDEDEEILGSCHHPDGGNVQWWIEDLKSTNGTFVNGIALRGTGTRLRNGDIVTLGTNDRNAAELKDGEWWEVERWSDTVFRFECFEKDSVHPHNKTNLTTPNKTVSFTPPSSNFRLPNNKRRKLTPPSSTAHEAMKRSDFAAKGLHAFNSPAAKSHKQLVGASLKKEELSSRDMSSTPILRPNHTIPLDSPKETATRAVYSGQISPINQHAGQHTLISSPCPPSSEAVCGKRDGIGSVLVSQYFPSGQVPTASAKLLLVGGDRARRLLCTASTRPDSSTSLSFPQNTFSSEAQDRRSSSPSSPPVLISMASPPPKAMSTYPIAPAGAAASNLKSPTGTPHTQGGAVLNRQFSFPTSKSREAGPITSGEVGFREGEALDTRSEFESLPLEQHLPEYEPVGINHLARHPLEGETLVCISAESLPYLDSSCAMWGRKQRSQWEQCAYRSGEKIFVKVERQLGKGGSAMVFKGKMLSHETADAELGKLGRGEMDVSNKQLPGASGSSEGRRGLPNISRGSSLHNMGGKNNAFNSKGCDAWSGSDEDCEESEDSDNSALSSSEEDIDESEEDGVISDDDNSEQDMRRISTKSDGSAFSSSSLKTYLKNTQKSDVSLKVVSRSDPSSISAFWTELDALISLSKANPSHPHLVRLIGVCFDANYAIAIISYHRGGPLSKWWKRHRKLNRGQKVGEHAVARVLHGACKALEFCHANGRLHLDVKENNIVFCRGVGDIDRVVLIDFGCAVSVGDTGGRVVDTGYDDYFEGGTFCCMAPEVLSIAVRALRHEKLEDPTSPPSFGAKADVWSLGVMAHVLLTGRYPYGLTGDQPDDIEAFNLLMRIRSGKAWDGQRDRMQLTPVAQDFLKQVLAIDVNKRLSLQEVINHPFIVQHCGSWTQI